jgi:hypothetical protein
MHKHLNVKTFFLALLFLNAFYTTAYSQSPTKEQTIDFLKSYYKNKGKMIFSEGEFTHKETSNSYTVISIKELTTCEYEIVWEWEYNYRNSRSNIKDHSLARYTAIINFSKVEEITFLLHKPRGSNTLFSLILKASPGVSFHLKKEDIVGGYGSNLYNELKNEIQIPANLQVDNAVIFPETEKVSKAFNHLRKLCGAPDPIKF